MQFFLLHSMQDYLIIAYTFMGAVAAFGYGPQIWTLIKSTGHSMSTPISTWTLWSAQAIVAFAYAAIVLQDLIASLVFGVDMIAAMAICALTIHNRHYRFGPPPGSKAHRTLAAE
jgi:hypothetical protein